jgi:hypothetical protein
MAAGSRTWPPNETAFSFYPIVNYGEITKALRNFSENVIIVDIYWLPQRVNIYWLPQRVRSGFADRRFSPHKIWPSTQNLAQEKFRAGVLRRVEESSWRVHFHDFAAGHEHDAIGDLARKAHLMSHA